MIPAVLAEHLGRLRLVSSIDEESGLAVIQAGSQGADREAQRILFGQTGPR